MKFDRGILRGSRDPWDSLEIQGGTHRLVKRGHLCEGAVDRWARHLTCTLLISRPKYQCNVSGSTSCSLSCSERLLRGSVLRNLWRRLCAFWAPSRPCPGLYKHFDVPATVADLDTTQWPTPKQNEVNAVLLVGRNVQPQDRTETPESDGELCRARNVEARREFE